MPTTIFINEEIKISSRNWFLEKKRKKGKSPEDEELGLADAHKRLELLGSGMRRPDSAGSSVMELRALKETMFPNEKKASGRSCFYENNNPSQRYFGHRRWVSFWVWGHLVRGACLRWGVGLCPGSKDSVTALVTGWARKAKSFQRTWT